MAGRDTQSQLEALDKIVAEYATYGRTIRAIRADGEFAAGTRQERSKLYDGIRDQGIVVGGAAPYEHAQN